MTKQEFVVHCGELLTDVYVAAKKHQKHEKLKYRAEGFIHAGKMLGVISQQEAIDLINTIHQQVYGETVDQRKQRKRRLKEALLNGDDLYVDQPAIERRNSIVYEIANKTAKH